MEQEPVSFDILQPYWFDETMDFVVTLWFFLPPAALAVFVYLRRRQNSDKPEHSMRH